MDRSYLAATTHLIDTLRRWQSYYNNMELHEAYQRFAKPSLGEVDPWKIVRYSWESRGELCYYRSPPASVDNLSPRPAALLTFFFSDPSNIREAYLKIMAQDWKMTSDVVCSGTESSDRTRQAASIANWFAPFYWHKELSDYYSQSHRTQFSADPFLQAVLTGWRSGKYRCPGGCGATEQGDVQIYQADNSYNYIAFIHLFFEHNIKGRLCVILRPTAQLDAENVYIASYDPSKVSAQ
ncbi:hypothetical protein CDD80_169 [Ophiocordyceps camponoti-rufipedis]|uniref:Uncharacterized protein n=1 Tax=Ophiocordyceps camponoti-rufipedis TaxID=2004952 RepID=A0A2C5XDA8_9HYPO|nr:hypothetical protein CDD80_169 [Ophiocordyceps camponoti-rufipedis]